MPRYRVFKDGKLVEEPTDIRKYWTDDLVTFVLGCSFSFELPILQAGIRLRHIERDTTVPMYRTSIDCVPAGRFKGKMVVSMRAIHAGRRHPRDADHLALSGRARCAGASRPARGDRHQAISASPTWAIPPRLRPGEMPVFWACGVTPQVAIEAARPPICITHKPGSMLITDKKNTSLAAL